MADSVLKKPNPEEGRRCSKSSGAQAAIGIDRYYE